MNCNKCNKIFKRKGLLIKHLNQEHSDCKDLIETIRDIESKFLYCEYCKTKCTNKSNRTSHMKICSYSIAKQREILYLHDTDSTYFREMEKLIRERRGKIHIELKPNKKFKIPVRRSVDTT